MLAKKASVRTATRKRAKSLHDENVRLPMRRCKIPCREITSSLQCRCDLYRCYCLPTPCLYYDRCAHYYRPCVEVSPPVVTSPLRVSTTTNNCFSPCQKVECKSTTYNADVICSSNITDERVARIEEERLERYRMIEAEIHARRTEQERIRIREMEESRLRLNINAAETRIKKAEDED